MRDLPGAEVLCRGILAKQLRPLQSAFVDSRASQSDVLMSDGVLQGPKKTYLFTTYSYLH